MKRFLLNSAVSLDLQLLSDVEEHLKCTITQCEPDIKVPVDEFDGKVSYGQRRTQGGGCVCSCPGSQIRTVDFCNDEAKMKLSNHTEMNGLLLLLLVGGNYKGHVDVLAPTVQELAGLEREAQSSFLQLGFLQNQPFRAF